MPDALEAYVDHETARELGRCGEQRGWTARVPAQPWRAKDGYTDAVLVTLVLETEQSAEKVILKASSRGGLEPDAYERAERTCPAEFRRHLMLAAMPPWFTRSGGVLTFQRLVADDVGGCRSLAAVPPEHLAGACAVVADGILRRWNDRFPPPRPWKISRFLRSEIGHDAGWTGPADWVTFPGDDKVYPNPFGLALDGSPLGDRPAEVLVGRRHGDLHLLNVLVPWAPHGTPRLAEFQLVDLDGFTEEGPLSSDPVTLVFSALAAMLPTLPPQGWSEVFDLVLRPEAPHPPNPALDVISTVHATALGVVAGQNAGWTGDWRQQWQMCSLATAASFTTFTSLGPKRRWWFFRLAAHLGRALLEDHAVSIPAHGQAAQNPFGPFPDAAVPRADPPVRRPATPDVDRLVARAWRRSPEHDDAAAELLEEAYGKVYELGPPSVVRDRLTELLKETTRILGAGHPMTLRLLHELATWTHRAGDARTAVRLYEEAASRRSDTLGSRHPDTKLSWKCARSWVLMDDAVRQT
jgi:hypothetical protein